MAKIKDIDYLQLSAYIRARESKLLNKERMERMLDAPSTAESLKVLDECGLGDLSSLCLSEIELRLGSYLAGVYDDIGAMAPDKRIVEALRLKYDYHNIKVLVKAEAAGTDGGRLLSIIGNIAPEKLRHCFEHREFQILPPGIAGSISEAREILAKTGDPQLADFTLDRNYCREFLNLAEAAESSFLKGYIRLFIDCANLRSYVRAVRLLKDVDFLRRALIEGGSVSAAELALCIGSEERFIRLFAGTPLKDAAVSGAAAVKGGRLTEFERLCDNALVSYLSGARLISFGEAPIISYLAAVEAEISAIRIIISGRESGLSAADIRQRLREV